MSTKKVYSEYSDGSYLEAIIKNGELIACPPLKISPPTEWGKGAVTLDQAIEFLTEIKKAKKETLKPGSTWPFNDITLKTEVERQRGRSPGSLTLPRR